MQNLSHLSPTEAASVELGVSSAEASSPSAGSAFLLRVETKDRSPDGPLSWRGLRGWGSALPSFPLPGGSRQEGGSLAPCHRLVPPAAWSPVHPHAAHRASPTLLHGCRLRPPGRLGHCKFVHTVTLSSSSKRAQASAAPHACLGLGSSPRGCPYLCCLARGPRVTRGCRGHTGPGRAARSAWSKDPVQTQEPGGSRPHFLGCSRAER